MVPQCLSLLAPLTSVIMLYYPFQVLYVFLLYDSIASAELRPKPAGATDRPLTILFVGDRNMKL